MKKDIVLDLTMEALKGYTDLEQSKSLAEFLPLESADMHYLTYSMYEEYCDEIVYTANLGKPGMYDKCCIPCWSLASLLNVLPEGMIENYYAPNLQKEEGKYSIAYGNEKLLCIADNPIDCCVKMIIKLNELKLL